MTCYLPKCSANCSRDNLSLPVLDPVSASIRLGSQAALQATGQTDSVFQQVPNKGKVDLAEPVQDPNFSLFYFSNRGNHPEES